MVKSIFLKIIYYLSLSTYNTLYKYIMIKNSLDNYSNGTGFMGMYRTHSSDSVNYVNIFILSLVSIFLIDFIINVIVFYIGKTEDLFTKFSNCWILILFIILSCVFLFVNEVVSFTLLCIGFILQFYMISKNIDKKSLFVITIFNVINFVLLYLISF